MPIEAHCGSCGRLLRAPDSAAGRRAKCPACGEVVSLPKPENTFDDEVYDAEEFSGFDKEFGGSTSPRSAEDYEEDYEATDRFKDPDDYEDDGRPRQPCPVCGEMILSHAKKCRFCGEVLDGSYRSGVDSRATRTKLERFRKEIHGLGGFWIFIGTLSLVILFISVSNDMLNPDLAEETLFILIPIAIFWIILGICTCLKQMWAVYVGLVLSYLSLLGNIFVNFNVCAIAIVAAAIVQAHRVIKWAGEFKEMGVPINMKWD